MNCPYCNKPLYHPIGKPTLSCQNWGCMETDNIIGNHSAWEKIIQLKSQLDIAMTCLNGVGKELPWVKRAIEEIAALEQKE